MLSQNLFVVTLLVVAVLGIGVVGYFNKEVDGLPGRFDVPELKRANELTGCDRIVLDDILYPCIFDNQDLD